MDKTYTLAEILIAMAKVPAEMGIDVAEDHAALLFMAEFINTFIKVITDEETETEEGWDWKETES